MTSVFTSLFRSFSIASFSIVAASRQLCFDRRVLARGGARWGLGGATAPSSGNSSPPIGENTTAVGEVPMDDFILSLLFRLLMKLRWNLRGDSALGI